MDNNNMKYITVLDFEAGRVFQYETIQPYLKDYEEYLTNKGHNLQTKYDH